MKSLLDLIQLGPYNSDLLRKFGDPQDCENMNNAICSLFLYHVKRNKLPQHTTARSAIYKVIDQVFKSKERLEE